MPPIRTSGCVIKGEQNCPINTLADKNPAAFARSLSPAIDKSHDVLFTRIMPSPAPTSNNAQSKISYFCMKPMSKNPTPIALKDIT